jgi:Skp family chaperone for outer membrane proteins
MRCLAMAITLGAALGIAPAASLAQMPPPSPPKPSQTAPLPPKPFPEGSRIAFINAQRILSESVLGKASLAKINTLRAQKLAELTVKNQELEAAQRKLAAGSLLSQDASAAAQKSVDRIQVDIQRAQQDAEAAMQELQQQLNDEFDRALAPVVAQVALDKGVHILLRLDTGAIAWADPALDLTGDSVKRLDTAKTAPPAKSATSPQEALTRR